METVATRMTSFGIQGVELVPTGIKRYELSPGEVAGLSGRDLRHFRSVLGCAYPPGYRPMVELDSEFKAAYKLLLDSSTTPAASSSNSEDEEETRPAPGTVAP